LDLRRRADPDHHAVGAVVPEKGENEAAVIYFWLHGPVFSLNPADVCRGRPYQQVVRYWQSRSPPIYRWALWNFFCTLWVILEGIIMVYVWRLYKIIKSSGGRELKGEENAEKGGSRPLLMGIPLLSVSFLAGYVFYQYNLLGMVEAKTIDGMGVYRISLFYIRICGLFWILFEWIVAIAGIRTYRLMKKAGEKHQ